MPLHEYVASNLGLMFSRDDGFADREKTSNLLQPVIDWGVFFFLPLDILFIYINFFPSFSPLPCDKWISRIPASGGDIIMTDCPLRSPRSPGTGCLGSCRRQMASMSYRRAGLGERGGIKLSAD